MVRSEGVPSYLKKDWGESRWRRVARFRLGCEVRESRYWLEEEKKLCRLCEWEEKRWEHVWERCRKFEEVERSWQEVVSWVLGEEGEGEEWMRKLEEERRELLESVGEDEERKRDED